MMAAIHPGREFGVQETGCLLLSSDELNFRKTSAFDNLRVPIPRFPDRFRNFAETREIYS